MTTPPDATEFRRRAIGAAPLVARTLVAELDDSALRAKRQASAVSLAVTKWLARATPTVVDMAYLSTLVPLPTGML